MTSHNSMSAQSRRGTFGPYHHWNLYCTIRNLYCTNMNS
jgi:hypothetical protein